MRCPRELVLVLSLFSSLAFAAASDKDIIQLGVKVSSQETDNALKTHDNPIDERQDILAANFNANLQNEWTKFSSRYDLTRWRYGENSLPDYSQIEGRTFLMLGRPDMPVGVSVSHSRHATLIAPDAIDISTNRDERTILGAQPWLNWRLDGNDNLRLTGIYSEVDFQKNETKNLKEKGAAFQWEHKISKTDRLALEVESTKNIYIFVPDYDYDYKAVLVNYAVQLSHLSYSLSAGENQAKQTNQNLEVKSPLYKVEVAYKSTANELGIFAGQSVTNTSNGGGNRDGLVSFGSESSEASKDLIRLREGELFWTIKNLCALCNLRLGVAFLNNDYSQLPDDETQNRATARFGYQMSRAAMFSVGYSRAKHIFSKLSLRSDYTELVSDVAFDYKIAKSSAVKLYVRNENRDSDSVLQTYDERIIGLSLAFEF